MLERNKIYCMEVMEGLKQLDDESVDLIGTNVVYHDSVKDVDILEHSPLYAHGLDAHKKDYVLLFCYTYVTPE